jgi:paraquat-inducible protein A
MPAAELVSAAPDRPIPTRMRLRECPDCGLMQHLPPLPRGATAKCTRCGAVLRQRRTDPAGRGLALGLAALVLFALAASEPFLGLDVQGRGRTTTLFSGPAALEQHGRWELGAVVLVTTVAAPLARLLATVWVLALLHLRHPPRHLYAVFRLAEQLRPWSMVEVFLLGALVAYTKLIDLAHVDIGIALYALGALTLAMAMADTALDSEAVWDTLESRHAVAGAPRGVAAKPSHTRLVSCDCCGLVSTATRFCGRCGAALHRRKPNSLSRTAALLAAAVALYIPANLLPVMTVVRLGHGAPSTILSGVFELAHEGMWPLAALVFFASITVPVLKIVGLGLLMLTTWRRDRTRLRDRTVLYRIVDAVGRWSMIDVFMISILTAMVRMGTIASVYPGPGAISFCAVVILTMLAAMTFDPRLMWDAAGRRA